MIINLKENYFSLEKWVKWYISLVVDLPTYRSVKQNEKINNRIIDFDDDIALEVLSFRKKLTTFGGKFLSFNILNSLKNKNI